MNTISLPIGHLLFPKTKLYNMSHFASLFQPRHFHVPFFRRNRKRVTEDFETYPAYYTNQKDWFSIPSHSQSFWEQDSQKTNLNYSSDTFFSSTGNSQSSMYTTDSSENIQYQEYQNHDYTNQTYVDMSAYTPSNNTRTIPISTSTETVSDADLSQKSTSSEDNVLHYNNNINRNSISQESFKGRIPLNQFLKAYGLRVKLCSMDGNCLFNSLSVLLYGTEKYHQYLRQTAVEWIRLNQDYEIEGGVKVKDLIFFKENQNSIEDYLNDMSLTGEWADYCCLLAICYSNNLNINVAFMSEDDSHVETIVEIRPMKQSSSGSIFWIQYNQCQMHYNALLPSQSNS